MSNDLFDTDNAGPVIDPNKDYRAELVGEGKKFKDDLALARAKVESDYFIESLKRENAELRLEVQSRAKLEDIVNNLQRQPERREEPLQHAPVTEPQKAWTDGDLDAALEKKLSERETSRRKEDNVRAAQQKLSEVFGAGYVEVLREKAAEIGVDPKWFNNLAAENPKALLKLVGAENTAPRVNDLFTPPPVGNNAGFKPSVTQRDKAFYDKMKKENSALYWHKDTQVAMHKDAMQLGERFFVTQ